LGVFATFGQLAMTRAYRTGQTVVVGALAYSTVVFSTLLDGLIWNERLPMTAWIGIAITVAAGIWAIQQRS
jgi:S-adenosylmethionine uptake transporter